MNYKIEQVTLTDFDEIDLIEKKIFSDPFPKSLLIHDFNQNPFSNYFKLTLDNKIVGYFGCWTAFEDCQIITVGVDTAYQGKGMGKDIVKSIIQFARESGCEKVTLEVRVTNQKAIQLYQGFGFIKLSLRKRYYENGDDAYLMKLDL
jgi:ribosomal-protein-alanine N-acetyltransferase